MALKKPNLAVKKVLKGVVSLKDAVDGDKKSVYIAPAIKIKMEKQEKKGKFKRVPAGFMIDEREKD